MFVVKSAFNGPLALTVGKGCITLTPNRPMDLEQFCSRKWILNDPTIQRLIAQRHLIVVHDSAHVLPQQPVGDCVTPTTQKSIVVEDPIIVELSDVADTDLDALLDAGEPLPEKEVEIQESIEEIAEEKPRQEFVCEECGFVAANLAGLRAHGRKHKKKKKKENRTKLIVKKESDDTVKEEMPEPNEDDFLLDILEMD